MDFDSGQPLIIQGDFTVLLETQHTDAAVIKKYLGQFADLIKSPEYLHTYRITPLSLWNAASMGFKAEEIISFLEKFGKYNLPHNIKNDIRLFMNRYGLIQMESWDSQLKITVQQPQVLQELLSHDSVLALVSQILDEQTIEIRSENRGRIKQELIQIGYPVEDLAGYHQGEFLPIEMRKNTTSGASFGFRDYQLSAVESFYQRGTIYGGNGILVLPCGSGKTVIGIGIMARLGCATLILTTNVMSVRQWKQEILDKTHLTEDQIGEYNGTSKDVRPVTVATYQILTYRKTKNSEFKHMRLFNERDWGLIIYDEVHLLPAPVFRVTADIQATRRLGLTATLIREDGRQEDVFSLIGPKRFDIPWKELEEQGWIAKVHCTEIRVPLDKQAREVYAKAEFKHKHRIAGEYKGKLSVISNLIRNHNGEPTLIIGQYLDQLKQIAVLFEAPMISGEMPHKERERLYNQFKKGELTLLIVSKVANFAIDLPDASVAIQVSGSFGSRQEEAQRMGRILRPKEENNQAYFYSIVSKDTKEQEFSMNRQLFLIEQGYRYLIKEAEQELNRELLPS